MMEHTVMRRLGQALLEYWVMQLAKMDFVSDSISLLPDLQLISVKLAQARNSGYRVIIDTGASPPFKLHPFSLMLLSFWKPNNR